MKFGTLLLGTAAAFVAVSGAQAADLPGEPVPAAVDYVKVCDTFGAGFFYIPGTETCLDISGRVRYTAAYVDPIAGGDFVRTRADARVDFDARTATEYGQLRSFFRIAAGGGRGEGVNVENAFIQLGYLTAGLVGGLFNGDVLYGINDAFVGADENVAIQVVVDDIGGGFFVGASVEGQSYNAQTDYETDLTMPNIVGVIGVAGQPWGDASLSLMYQDDGNATDFSGLDPISTSETFGVKATGNFVLTEGFDVRATAAYFSDADASDDVILLSLAAKYAVSEAADLYAGIRYDIVDGDDSIFANVGVDYEVVPGLIATGEIAYADVGGNDGFGVFGRLTRNW